MTDTQARPHAAAPLRIGVIAGSTRPTRRSPAIARWVAEGADEPTLRLEVIDLLDHGLPMLCEPVAAVFGAYEHEVTRAWSRTIAAHDAFVLVTPEYNASFPAVLKNALDHLYAEWHDKPVGLVGCGMSGGILAVEALRPVVAELRMHPVPTSLHLSPHQVEDDVYVATDGETEARSAMLRELATLGDALRSPGPTARSR